MSDYREDSVSVSLDSSQGRRDFLKPALASSYQRKLKILVVNDNNYQLLIITTSLVQLPEVGKIDQASNGQEALELVKQNKQNPNCEDYDIILLDLEMPIMDGYNACLKITQFYEFYNQKVCIKHLQSQRQVDTSLIQNLVDQHQDLIEYCDNSNSEVDLDINLQESAKSFLNDFNKIRFYALNHRSRPFLFAYSALVNQQVQRKT